MGGEKERYRQKRGDGNIFRGVSIAIKEQYMPHIYQIGIISNITEIRLKTDNGVKISPY